MADQQDTYRKLILVTSDTSGLVNLQGDVNKANQVLQQMGLKGEQATKVLDKGTAITNNFGKITTTSMSQIETASGKTFNVITKGGTQSSKSLNEIVGVLPRASAGIAVLEKAMMRVLIVVPVWFLMRTAMMGLIQSIQEGAKFLVEFESAIANIRVVGKGTEEEYKRLGDTILSFSSVYGVAATDALKASQIFAQQGLKINEVINMTRTSMVAAVVLGKDVATVAEDLTAAVRAYNVPMENSMTIVDKWMKVQKNFAVTATDLAEATKKAGATASSFGVSYDKFLGDVTAIIELTRKSGSEAGNSLQMMYTRLFSTGAKAVQEIAKVPIYQDAVGKSTFQNTNIYRNASDVIDDMAKSWDKLSESEKIELATQIGSRRQATPFIALMNNYKRSIEAQVDSLTSAGDALNSFNIIQDTTKVKITQMQNTWITLTHSLGDTSTFKFVIDTVKNLAEGLIFLANATDYAALKMRQKKQADIDATEVNLSRLDALKKLNELETKINNNPSEKNQELLSKIKSSREAILSANPDLALMDVKSEQYKIIRDEIYRDRATEIQKLRMAEMNESGKVSPFILTGWSQQRATNELVKKYGSVSSASKQIMDSIDKEIKARMATQNISGLLGEVEENKISDVLDKELRKYKEIEEEVAFRAEIMKNLGYSEKQILEWEIQQYDTNGVLEKSIDAQNKKRQLGYELIKKTTGEIKAQSDILQKSVSDTILAWEKGGTSLLSGFQSIGDTIRNSMMTSVAEGLSTNIINSTGIGQIFGMMNVSLKDFTSGQGGIAGGIENGAYKGTYKGVKDALSSNEINKAVWTGATSNTGSSGRGWTIPGFGQGGWFNQPVGGNQYAQVNGGATSALVAPANYYKSQRQMTNGQAAGIGVMGAMTGYSQFQSAQAGGMPLAQSIGSGILTGAGSILAGVAIANEWNPVGWILTGALLIGGLLMGSLGGKKSQQTSVTTSTQENAISSKISVSNKQLELVNRNLIALRTDIRSYILPSSSYFSAKSGNIENEYSIMSRAGYSG